MAPTPKTKPHHASSRAHDDLLSATTSPPFPVALVTREPDVASGLSRYDGEALSTANKAGGWDTAPRILTLGEGDVIRGLLVGEGDPAEIEDTVLREIKTIRTWVIEFADGARASILSSSQLDKALPPRIGHEVIIARGGNVETRKGQRVTEYIVKSRQLA